MEALLTGVVAGYGIAIPVGAIAVLIVQVGLRCGFWCAFSAGLGAASADLIYAIVAVVAGRALTDPIESIETPLRLVSALILAAIAVYGLLRLRSKPSEIEAALPGRREFVSTYFRFLGLTLVNPLTVIYFTAFVVGVGVAAGLSAPAATVFALGAFAASLSWQTVLAAVGAGARHRLGERFRTGAVLTGNLIVLAMAALIVLR